VFIGLFQSEELSFIDLFLRRSQGVLQFPDSLSAPARDFLMQARKVRNFDTFAHFMQTMNALACAQDTVTVEKAGSSLHAAIKINKVKDYVNEHYRNPIKLSEVAGMTGLTPNSFSRFFMQHTGQTFCDYVNSVRVDKAASLLLISKETVASIAYSCGFNSPHYFNNTFKRLKGVTPGEVKN